ncbi:MAG TPA: DUF4136 domain-containing protein [Acidobacteriota bacterium]|nr:DUF4136 domain-containing protein [Acidobacteriota bacterium]
MRLAKAVSTVSALVIVSGLMAAFLVGAEDQKFDFDSKTDFSRFKTYSWMPDMQVIPPYPEVDRSQVESAFKEVLEDTLAARGMTRIDSGTPDVYVKFTAMLYYGYQAGIFESGAGSDGPFVETDSSLSIEQDSQVIISFVEPTTQETLWRGTSVEKIDKPRDLPRKVRKQAEKLLEKYPPRQ